MAVSTTNAYDGPFSANGVTTSFPFTFTAQSVRDVAVLLDDQPLIEGYTVELYEGGGGTVTFGEAPGPGHLVVWLDPDFTQTTAFENGSAWLAAPVNLANDRAALRDQALSRDLKRCMRLPLGENAGTLPSATKRKGKFLAFSPIDGTAVIADAVITDALLRADVASTDANKGATLIGTSGGGTLQNQIDRTTLPTVAALLASMVPARGAGTVWRAGPFAYVEAAASATDQHLTTAAGVKLYATPQGQTVWAEQFGAVGDGVTNCLAQIQKAVNTGYHVLFGAGSFVIGSGSIKPVNADQTLAGGAPGARIVFSGSSAISIRPAQGLTGAAMFTTFATNLRVQRLYFQRTAASSTAYAIRAINVRGLHVEDCEYAACALLYVTAEANENGTYNTANGSVSVDPAVVAGFNPNDINDLNEHIYVRRNRSWNTSYGIPGVRINFARHGEISGNTLAYGNISWWGGGADFAKGGSVQFLRRFAHFRIFGNYCSWNNGGIYGNCGESVVVSGNTLEYSTDTALDFEGCSNCLATGNVIRHFGNFACSTFYAAINVAFRGNTIECTLAGANTGASVAATNYMQSTAITAFADNGDGTTKVTVGSALDLQSGQLVLISEIASTPLLLTRLSATEFTVGIAYSASFTAGYLRYQQGRTFFQVIAGNSVNSTTAAQEVVDFSGNSVIARDGLIGRSNDGPADMVVVSNNMLTNCAIHLTSGMGMTKVVENNRLLFTYASVPQRVNMAFIDVQGYRNRASVCGNQIVVVSPLAWIPAGAYAVNVVCSAFSASPVTATIEQNRMTIANGATIAGGLYHSTENTHPSNQAAATIAGNMLSAITEGTTAGKCATVFRDNLTPQGLPLDKLQVGAASGSTVTLTGNARSVVLTNGVPLAALTLVLPVDPADEATYRITSRSAVTALTVTNASTGSPTVIGTAPTTLAAGQTVQVRFSKSLNAWIWG